MKLLKIFAVIYLAFVINSFSQNVNPNFDYTGIEQFYKVITLLERNQEPTARQWEKLFNTPGYKVLTSGEFTKEYFKKKFKLVFMPSKSKDLRRELKNRKDISHLSHFIKVRDNKRKVLRQLENLKRTPYNKEAIQRTLKFLPQNYVNQYPPVAFVIFENNGRGSSPIVVDLAASMQWDFVSFLSHEFHHWYRNRQMKFNYRNVSNNDLYLVQALDHIEAEGIADMVDKRDWFTKASNSVSTYARSFIDDVSRTPYVIKQMDELLISANEYPNNRKQIGRKILQLLPQKGHTTGYFMASLILETLGKNKLVDCLGNPFKFILTYNKAAKINGRYPSFSSKALTVIKELNSGYSIKK